MHHSIPKFSLALYLLGREPSLMHNAGKVNDKLAKTDSALTEGQQITIQSKTISEAIHTYRTFCLEVDQGFESLG